MKLIVASDLAADRGNDDGPLKVIFLMGKTGVGKSTFINLLGGKNMETGLPPVVGHGSHSCKFLTHK